MKYYAVVKGRGNEEPTIFWSWAVAHPRVTHYSTPDWKKCRTLEEARSYMKAQGVENPREDRTGEGYPASDRGPGFYAVAHGRVPGVYTHWYSEPLEGGAREQVDGVVGACHQKFRTWDQAMEFNNNWERANAQVENLLRLRVNHF